jgi:hypothetical protein
MRDAGIDAEIVDDDDRLWDAQRDGQRPRPGEPDTIVRVSGVQTDLPMLLEAAGEHDAPLVGRAPLGLSWLRLEDAAAVPAALARLRGIATAVVLDAPPEVRAGVDPWGDRDEAVLELMRRVKQGFDPSGACSPGVLV